jgi:hypothetical protein
MADPAAKKHGIQVIVQGLRRFLSESYPRRRAGRLNLDGSGMLVMLYTDPKSALM